jgi:hypothetical protein
LLTKLTKSENKILFILFFSWIFLFSPYLCAPKSGEGIIGERERERERDVNEIISKSFKNKSDNILRVKIISIIFAAPKR